MLRHGDTTGRELPNAACHMQTYNGGLQCCAHKNFLTDLEQDPLIPNKTDTYFLKWRYYFQEYVPANPANNTPASHLSLYHWVFLIDDAVNDYEEDNAHYGQASMGRITAHLNVDTMGIENRPTEATNVTFLVMTLIATPRVAFAKKFGTPTRVKFCAMLAPSTGALSTGL